MKIFLKTLFFCIFLSSTVKANAFSEVFGSEGAAGISQSKIRSLSYTFQYFTLVGSIGYVAKQLHNSGFMEPLGIQFEGLDSLFRGSGLCIKIHFGVVGIFDYKIT